MVPIYLDSSTCIYLSLDNGVTMTSKRRENKNLVSVICFSFLVISFSKQLQIVSISLAFESYRNNQGTEFKSSVSKPGKKIQIRGCVFTFSVNKVHKWSFHVAGLPRTGKKCTEIRKGT